MTVIVQNEKYNPYGRTWWGGTPPDRTDKTHTVRTGICLTTRELRRLLLRRRHRARGAGAGDDPGPLHVRHRARHERGAHRSRVLQGGARRGARSVGAPPGLGLGGGGPVPGIHGWNFRARRMIRGMGLMNFPRYIQREARDFFYMTLRYLLPGPRRGGSTGGRGALGDAGLAATWFSVCARHDLSASGARAARAPRGPFEDRSAGGARAGSSERRRHRAYHRGVHRHCPCSPNAPHPLLGQRCVLHRPASAGGGRASFSPGSRSTRDARARTRRRPWGSPMKGACWCTHKSLRAPAPARGPSPTQARRQWREQAPSSIACSRASAARRACCSATRFIQRSAGRCRSADRPRKTARGQRCGSFAAKVPALDSIFEDTPIGVRTYGTRCSNGASAISRSQPRPQLRPKASRTSPRRRPRRAPLPSALRRQGARRHRVLI